MYVNHVLLSSYAVSGGLCVSNALQHIKALAIMPYRSQEYIIQSKSSLFFSLFTEKEATEEEDAVEIHCGLYASS